MKKHYLFVIAGLLATEKIHSQCSVTITATPTEICEGETAVLEAEGSIVDAQSLSTTFASGNNLRGNMFDVEILNTIILDSIDIHLIGTTDIEIYHKTGTYAGFEANAGAWTLIGSATNVVGEGSGVPTSVPTFIDFTLTPGNHAFYVTSSNTSQSIQYTDGSSVGALYSSDANINLYEGVGLDYPFTGGGSIFSPRVWNGNIHYSVPISGTPTYTWSTTETSSSIEVGPTTTTTYTCEVEYASAGCTAEESIEILVNALPNVVANSSATEICEGDSVQLTGSGADSYSWDNGVDNNDYITLTTTTTFEVTGTDANGCQNTDNIEIAVSGFPDVVANASATELCSGEELTLTASGNADSYSWSHSITDGSPFPITVSNTFYLTGVNAFGCETVDSIEIIVNDCASTKSEILSQIAVYPNPASDLVNISLPSQDGVIRLIDAQGKTVKQLKVNQEKITLNVNEFQTGIYILEYKLNGKSYHRKVNITR